MVSPQQTFSASGRSRPDRAALVSGAVPGADSTPLGWPNRKVGAP